MSEEGKGPWDAPSAGADGDTAGNGPSKAPDNGSAGPSNPWDPDAMRKTGKPRGPSLEDIFRRTKGSGGGGFGGLPTRPDGKSWWPIIAGGLVLLWLSWSSVHRLGPEQQGVVTTFGKYSHTVGPGIAMTAPFPIQRLEKLDTQQIRTTPIVSSKSSNDNLVLTKDQNIIDMAYDVRWSIKSPERFLFQLDQPEQTVQEVSESAMRATVANFNLTQAIGDGRAEIEGQVLERMQAILDEYRSGVLVQSVSIRQSDPPAEVTDAFRAVNAAQQKRESNLNDARAYASQVTQLALGETAEFDKIYEQYKTAPEVTKRRLYYETMEQILGKVDKTIVESGAVTPYLPLPEMQRRNSGESNSVTVTGKKQ